MWLNVVRLARDAGDISSLFPSGIKSLADLPFTLHNAIRLALHFLSFEELPTDERPPKRIWLNPKLMKQHWEWVRGKREAEMKGDTDTTEISKMSRNTLLDELLVEDDDMGDDE